MPEVAARDGGDRATRPRPAGGVPAAVVLPVAVALSVAGSVFDLRVNHTLGLPFDVVFVLAGLAAVLVIRPSGLVVAMFAPPLVLILAAAVGVLTEHGLGGGAAGVGLAIATPVLPQFPVMAGTTAATLVIGTVRLVRVRKAASSAGGSPRVP